MKKILILFFAIIILTSCERKGAREYRYSGIIESKGKEDPTSGYKSSSDAKYYVMLRENVTNKIIRIEVTVPTWHDLNKGTKATFTLTNWDLYYSGNTTDMTKNLYGE